MTPFFLFLLWKDFIYLLPYPIDLSLTPSSVAWLKQLHLWFLFSCLFIFWFSTLSLWDAKCHSSNYLKSGQAKAAAKPQFVHTTRWVRFEFAAEFSHLRLVSVVSAVDDETSCVNEGHRKALKRPFAGASSRQAAGKLTRPITQLFCLNSNVTQRAPLSYIEITDT